VLCCIEAAFCPPAIPKTISLEGDWHFAPDPTGSARAADLDSLSAIRPTHVPSSWQSQFVDMRDYAGVAWYWRPFTLTEQSPGEVILVRFGAVDYKADVYLNGQKAGSHEGGYLPFEFDITPFVKTGENQIAVRVADPGANPNVVEGIRFAEIPHGKQNWYVQTSGLWQSVELDFRPAWRLGAVHISAGADGKFKISEPLLGTVPQAEGKTPPYAGAEIRDASDNVVWKAEQNFASGQSSCEFSGQISKPDLWSLAHPTLYKLHAWLSSGDSQTYNFGFRTFESRGGKFYLNGQVIYLRGALDQAFYPETIYTPPSLEYLQKEMAEAKALGLNLLRCHIKVPDPRYLEAADEAGILIWCEIPNWDKLTKDSERRGLETLRGMAERDWNHPSLVMVTLINESWGANLKEAADRAWLRQTYAEAKKIVPGWLVVDNSPCCDNFHMASDLADFHQYQAIPDHASDFDRLVADLARRPGWLFSPYGDAAPKGDEPLVLSEFGNWGLPRLPETEPWWFSRGFKQNPATLPEGIEKRFADFKYSSLFPGVQGLADATEWAQYRALKYEIGSLRMRPEIQGYVITQFTDVNWEANGLLDMWRRPKVYAEMLTKLQQDDLVIVRPERRNFAADEKGYADVYFSHYIPDPLTGAQVNWTLEGTLQHGSFYLPDVPSGSGARVGKFEFIAPAPASPSNRALKVQVTLGGKIISENSAEVFFYQPKLPDLPPPVSFHDPGGRLRRLVNEMRERTYQVPTGSEAFPVMISSTFDDTVKKTLQAGGRVILLASDLQTLAPGIEVSPRAGSDLDGNWISAFLWVRKDQEPFKSLGFDTLVGFETEAVTPSAVIAGVPPENFHDVLAGMFYGWMAPNVATFVQAKAGKGKILICTFSLATSYGSDPYATILLDAMVNYIVTSPVPGFEIPLGDK